MSLIAFGAENTQVAAHKYLLSDERYAQLAEMFRGENQRIFQISAQSAFSACLHAGIAAHKSPHCRPQSDSRCIVCSKLYELADGLPVAHASNSRFEHIFSGCFKKEIKQNDLVPPLL